MDCCDYSGCPFCFNVWFEFFGERWVEESGLLEEEVECAEEKRRRCNDKCHPGLLQTCQIYEHSSSEDNVHHCTVVRVVRSKVY